MSNSQPLISVIVPVYKVAEYLDKCMESIVSQSYTNLEIILVDDGSPDNCGALCDGWAEKDSRIRVIHQKNTGLSGARNTGIEHATGEFILFVDSDDILSPELCSVLLQSMGSDTDIAICDAEHIFPGKPYEFSVSSQRQTMSAQEAICAMWYQTAFLPSAWAKLYRSCLFESRRFTVGRLFEDIDIMHEVFADARSIVYDHSRLYGYVHRENSLTTNSFSKKDLDILLIAQKILTFAQTRPQLRSAARSYAVTAALRIYLNAPDSPDFQDGLLQAKSLLDQHGKAVLGDPHIRRKNRYALRLYFLCKPALRMVYKHINRWK